MAREKKYTSEAAMDLGIEDDEGGISRVLKSLGAVDDLFVGPPRQTEQMLYEIDEAGKWKNEMRKHPYDPEILDLKKWRNKTPAWWKTDTI